MSFQDIELKPEYRSRLDNVIRDFYNPILKQSVVYKRAVGFFSSSALLSLTAGICGLVENDGRIQMIASPRLQPDDIDAINDGLRRRDDVIKEALLRELRDPKGKFEEARLNLLSNLIAAGRLEIKIAFLEDDNMIGMFHEKLGLMYDAEDNIIAFSGSMNESANAFTKNYEAIDVFASWTQDTERVARPYYLVGKAPATFSLIPIDAHARIDSGELERDDIDLIVKEQLLAPQYEYSYDYVEYDEQANPKQDDISADIDLMLLEIDDDDEDDNPFGEVLESDDEGFDEFGDEYTGEFDLDEYGLDDVDPNIFKDPTLMVKWLKKMDSDQEQSQNGDD